MLKLHLILLGTSACHLCEEALAIMTLCQTEQPNLIIKFIDIAESPEWQLNYATRIPVLYHPETQQDLGWPFELVDVNVFIEALTHD